MEIRGESRRGGGRKGREWRKIFSSIKTTVKEKKNVELAMRQALLQNDHILNFMKEYFNVYIDIDLAVHSFIKRVSTHMCVCLMAWCAITENLWNPQMSSKGMEHRAK